MVRYISHPQSEVDPRVPVTAWGLSDTGRRRVRRCLEQPWIPSIVRIVSSPEPKAMETATVLGEHLGIGVEVREATGEIDRSSTGYLPPDEHERLADRLFGEPDMSVRGWERAVDAQARIASALADVLAPGGSGDVAVVGHGGVGTLLMCRLTGSPIGREHDQPGQGHYWSYDVSRARMVHRWRPIDAVSA